MRGGRGVTGGLCDCKISGILQTIYRETGGCVTRGICESGCRGVTGLYDCKIFTILQTIYTRRQEDVMARGAVYLRGVAGE